MISFRAKTIGIVNATHWAAATVSAVAMTALSVSTASAQQLDPPIDARVAANQAGAESQKRVEEIASATDSLIAEFRLTNKKIESLQIFNRSLSEVIVSQNEELTSLQRQIDGVEEVGRAVTPLMLKMIEANYKVLKLNGRLPRSTSSFFSKLWQLARTRSLMVSSNVSMTTSSQALV